jgi:hypothetical protein
LCVSSERLKVCLTGLMKRSKIDFSRARDVAQFG